MAPPDWIAPVTADELKVTLEAFARPLPRIEALTVLPGAPNAGSILEMKALPAGWTMTRAGNLKIASWALDDAISVLSAANVRNTGPPETALDKPTILWEGRPWRL